MRPDLYGPGVGGLGDLLSAAYLQTHQHLMTLDLEPFTTPVPAQGEGDAGFAMRVKLESLQEDVDQFASTADACSETLARLATELRGLEEIALLGGEISEDDKARMEELKPQVEEMAAKLVAGMNPV